MQKRIQRSISGAIVLCALAAVGRADAEPVRTVRLNGDPSNRIDVAFLGDGYRSDELAKYAADVDAIAAALFQQEPFRSYRSYFNIHRVDVVSAQSGSDHPASGIFRDTALGSAYDCASITRLICVDLGVVNDVLLRNLVADRRDVVIVLVNDPEYGGSGGAAAVASVHPAVVEVMLHEMGHTLGLLADEYDYQSELCTSAGEPFAANATIETDRTRLKWRQWIDAQTPVPTYYSANPETPGLYEGAQYCPHGKHRPTYDSKMRSLDRPFEQVNSEELTKRFYDFVSPIDELTRETVHDADGSADVFRVRTPRPFSHGLNVHWWIDGRLASERATLRVPSGSLAAGTHRVSVTVSDPTPFVRHDPDKVLQESRSVEIVVGADRSTVALPAMADAYVRDGVWASGNFGGSPTLLAKKGLSADVTRRSYVKFDISGLDTIGAATLRFYGRVSSTASAQVRVGIHAVPNQSWDERTVTWNTKPSYGPLLATMIVTGTSPGWVDVDLTAFVQAARRDGRSQISVALRALEYTSAYAILESRESPSFAPQLSIRR